MQRFRFFSSTARSLQGAAKPEKTSKPWGSYDSSNKLNSFREEDMATLRKAVDRPSPDSINPRFWPSTFSQKTTYEPTDFSLNRIKAARQQRNTPQVDQFVKHNMNPMDYWTNPVILSQFLTQNGKIKPAHQIGNKGPTQRKLAKAIRRCRAAGLLSTVHRDVSQLPKFTRYRPTN